MDIWINETIHSTPLLLRALVVDGDERVRRTCSALLHELGCDSVEAADGVEAVQNASERGIDFILTSSILDRLSASELVHLTRRGVFGSPPPPVIVRVAKPQPSPSALDDLYPECALLTSTVDLGTVQRSLQQAFERYLV